MLNRMPPIVSVLAPQELARSNYDLALVALGYETRARALATKIRGRIGRRVSIAFESERCLDFSANRACFKRRRYSVDEVPDSTFRQYVTDVLAESVREAASVLRVVVDISSFTRFRLAVIAEAVQLAANVMPVEVSWHYTIADHSNSDRDDLPFVTIGPVTPLFAGAIGDARLPTSAIVGLGYEAGRAIGALERLQADSTWLLEPVSPIRAYTTSLRAANDVLLRTVPPARVSHYQVLDPFRLFVVVESLASGLARSSRPAILPFGPKVFALIAYFVSQGDASVSVWRVSAGEPSSPVNRTPSPFCCAIRTRYSMPTRIL